VIIICYLRPCLEFVCCIPFQRRLPGLPPRSCLVLLDMATFGFDLDEGWAFIFICEGPCNHHCNLIRKSFPRKCPNCSVALLTPLRFSLDHIRTGTRPVRGHSASLPRTVKTEINKGSTNTEPDNQWRRQAAWPTTESWMVLPTACDELSFFSRPPRSFYNIYQSSPSSH